MHINKAPLKEIGPCELEMDFQGIHIKGHGILLEPIHEYNNVCIVELNPDEFPIMVLDKYNGRIAIGKEQVKLL